MATRNSARNVYDPRVRELIRATGDPHLFPELNIPRSTISGWLRGDFKPAVGVGTVVENGCVSVSGRRHVGYRESYAFPPSLAGSKRRANAWSFPRRGITRRRHSVLTDSTNRAEYAFRFALLAGNFTVFTPPTRRVFRCAPARLTSPGRAAAWLCRSPLTRSGRLCLVVRKYVRELRALRRRHFKRDLAEKLRAAGVNPDEMEQSFYRDMRNLQNRTRGPLFELLAEVSIQQTFRDGRNLKSSVGLELAPEKHVRFETPDGLRVADLYYRADRSVVEVKSGYIYASRDIKAQVKKDRWLLANHDEVDEVVWVLFRGGSAPLLAHLGEAGIRWIDMKDDEE
jgi:hypothetical protein